MAHGEITFTIFGDFYFTAIGNFYLTINTIVQLIKGMDVTYEKVAEVLEVPLARVLSVAEREGLSPKKES